MVIDVMNEINLFFYDFPVRKFLKFFELHFEKYSNKIFTIEFLSIIAHL